MRGIEPICQSYDKALGHNSSQKLCMGRYKKVNVLKKEIRLKYNLTTYFMNMITHYETCGGQCHSRTNPKITNVIADPSKISQVLTNLIVNSINYGKEGGRTKIKYFDLGENILVEVNDNGRGIGEEHLSRLFERFYRVDKGRSRAEGGSGLGLAIVKHIMEAHDQTINVRSKLGEGSTFSFTLEKA